MTRSRRGARRLAASPDRDQLFENLPFPVIETSVTGRVLRVNRRARRLLAVPRSADLEGRSLASAVFALASRPAVRVLIRQLADNGRPLLHEGLAVLEARGRCRQVLVHAGRIKRPGILGHRLCFMLADVTAFFERFNRLLNSEAKWSSLIESAPDIILIIDRTCKIRFINRVPDGETGQVLGRSVLDFAPAADRAAIRGSIRETFASGQAGCYETRGITPAGNLGWYAICISPIRSRGRIDEALLVARDISQAKQTEAEIRMHRSRLRHLVREKTAEIRMANTKLVREIKERKAGEARLVRSREGLRCLSHRLEKAQEEERAALARDIHDEIGSALTTLKMSIDLLKDRHEESPIFRLMQVKIKDSIDEAMSNVRDLIARLRPPILDDLGLGAALSWQARRFEERTGITCRVVLFAKGSTVTGERATALFRVFQELLTNVARHAGATEVKVGLRESAGAIALAVADNGRGIPREAILSPGSSGLLGIQERLAQFGGSLKIIRPKGGGTLIRVVLPAGEGPR